jgi:hypothetical protein
MKTGLSLFVPTEHVLGCDLVKLGPAILQHNLNMRNLSDSGL